MRIAYIGIKGLPGTFSGIETHVHELGTRLVKRGHEVFAYVRPHYTPYGVCEDDGIQLIHRPSIATKHLDASVHSLISAIHAIGRDFDIVHFHAIGPGAFAPLARLSRARVVTTIHRFDYLSGKWGRFARACLQAAERTCLKASHRTIVVAPFLRDHYRTMGYETEYIPNGVPMPETESGSDEIGKLGLQAGMYYLFLGRLVPEKRPDWAIRTFMKVCNEPDKRLVITGGSSATDDYVNSLKKLAQPDSDRILFTGPIYGKAKAQLLGNCRAFMLPSALEGLPITLLEAMSHSRPCLVSDIPPHKDVIANGQNGFLFDETDLDQLHDRMHDVEQLADTELSQIGSSARRTVADGYDWEEIIDSVERCYESALGTPAATRQS